MTANAPKLCPADPLKFSFNVSFGNPFSPYNLEISLLRIAPTDLSVFLILNFKEVLIFLFIDSFASFRILKSKTFYSAFIQIQRHGF